MNLIEKVIKPEIKNLVRIKDTMDDRFEYLRLDKNERLLPFYKKLFDYFKTNIKSEDLSGYYELGPIYRQLANYLGINENQVLLTAGSDLAIKSVFEACVEKGDNVVLHLPSYGMYRVYAKMFGSEARAVPIKEDYTINIIEMLNRVDERTKIFALENPNGFISTIPSLDQIEYCAKELNKRNVVLLIDEAYIYVEKKKTETIPLIDKYPNVVITQTFSKAHGLAGVRVGFLMGHSDIMEYISRVRPMHEIGSLPAIATKWMLDNPLLLDEFQESIKESKAYLKFELEKINIAYKDTHANFMLLYFPNEGRTANLAQKLRERKILVRRPFEESFLKGWSRVCVGSLDDSRIFIKTLRSLLEGQ
jgi:histidinol-phosphate aminotransferase